MLTDAATSAAASAADMTGLTAAAGMLGYGKGKEPSLHSALAASVIPAHVTVPELPKPIVHEQPNLAHALLLAPAGAAVHSATSVPNASASANKHNGALVQSPHEHEHAHTHPSSQ